MSGGSSPIARSLAGSHPWYNELAPDQALSPLFFKYLRNILGLIFTQIIAVQLGAKSY
jgi:hypothetical protein